MSKFDKIFSCKSLKPFVKTMHEILPWGGVSDSLFVQCMYKNLPFLTKIYPHYKSAIELYAEPKGMHSVDTEIEILKIFKQTIIDKNYTPCILEIINAKTCENVVKMISKEVNCSELTRSSSISDIDRLYSAYCKYAENVLQGLAYDKMSYVILERCDWPIHYLLANSIGLPADGAIFLSLIFQLIHAMYVLSVIYPKFRHRDLHTGNIMIKIDRSFQFDPNTPQVLLLRAFGKEFYIPFFGLYIKIIDFGHSILPEEGIISNMVYDKRHAVERTDHDILWFFYWLTDPDDRLRMGEVMAEYVYHLLDSLDPNEMHYRYRENVSYINEHPELVPTYKDMLNNSVFDEYLDRGKANIYHAYDACDL